MKNFLTNLRLAFFALLFSWLLLPVAGLAQGSPPIPAAAQAILQMRQPLAEPMGPVTASAAFDPPTVRPGQRTFYRVQITATESAIQWPDALPWPSALAVTATARGQVTQYLGNNFLPHTTFLYELQPSALGVLVVSNFTVSCAGQPLEIPAASLNVVTEDFPAPGPRQLLVETGETNLYLGQPFSVRVLLPASQGNQVEALREVQLNGTGLLTDATAGHQSIDIINDHGQLKPAFICQMTATPIAAGPMSLSAQAFTAGREFSGPISIHGGVSLPGGPTKYDLLISDPVTLHIRPLPAADELPGFTGAIGVFQSDPPVLGTNRLRVGEPVHLKLTFHGAGDLARFVPPAPPESRDWQIIVDPPPATGFTLIPLTDEVHATPAIPFCSFDPVRSVYDDHSIAPLPVTVVGEGLPLELRSGEPSANDTRPARLSDLASQPGKLISRLQPLQLQGWFVVLQFLPVLGLLGLWQWDRHRRFWEAHPDLARRRQARRDLRREKIKLNRATAGGDTDQFVQHAVAAMQIAVAPHYPANPQALVGGDVLAQLDPAEQPGPLGETVKQIFAAADRRFALKPASPADWLDLKDQVENVLLRLEEKL